MSLPRTSRAAFGASRQCHRSTSEATRAVVSSSRAVAPFSTSQSSNAEPEAASSLSASSSSAPPPPPSASAPSKYESPLRRLRHAQKGLRPEDGPQVQIQNALLNLARERGISIPDALSQLNPDQIRLPRSVQALHLAPLKREAKHGVTVCNLQLRSFSARNLEFMADFALRAAYYLDLPAKGPVPLPRITERWTVPRSVFVHKKSQENWERVTMRRLIQIQDGHPESVQRWLAFIRKWTWYGVGMKADVWEHESIDVIKNMDANEEAVKAGVESIDWRLFGRKKGSTSAADVVDLLDKHGFAGADNAQILGSANPGSSEASPEEAKKADAGAKPLSKKETKAAPKQTKA